MGMEVIVFETEKEVDQFVSKHIIDFIKTKTIPVLGFATGSSPLGIYDNLIHAYTDQKVDFTNVKAFNLDEYVGIDKEHPRSFTKFMNSYLFSKINIPSDQIYALNGKANDMDEECKNYEHLIDENPIDIQLLGIGMDGHIGYNEPGSSFSGGCHVVNLHSESIQSSLNYGFTCIEDVPKQGVTQGISTIMKAKQLILIAKGIKKAKLVKHMLEGEISEDFPSTIIRIHDNVLVVLDKEAAKYLKEEENERS